jgi:hypothetical protein
VKKDLAVVDFVAVDHHHQVLVLNYCYHSVVVLVRLKKLHLELITHCWLVFDLFSEEMKRNQDCEVQPFEKRNVLTPSHQQDRQQKYNAFFFEILRRKKVKNSKK